MPDIPINDVARRVQFTSSGSAGPYAFTFAVLSQDDVAVYSGATLKTLTTHYTVSLNANGTGSITYTSGNIPASGVIVTVTSDQAVARTSDYTSGGDFKAQTINDDLDKLTINQQQAAEVFNRTLTVPITDPVAVSMVLPAKADRLGKVLSFHSTSGDPAASQELGEFEGNWATGTAYVLRDIVKDTTNNNIYICITAHTSSGANLSASDSANWSLIVDAASATTSQTAAAASAQLADDWANKTSGVVASSEYSSKAYAIGGTGVTDTSSKGAAKEWAIETSGTVDGTDYSAKEYAAGTQASTGGSAKSWAQDTDQVNGAGTNDRSAKNWAQGSSMTGSTLGGSAKDWAQTTGGTVDGTNYAAKEWALGTTVGDGSAKDWAVLAEDSAVTGSSYSALHHAAKSAASATAAASSATGAASSASTASTQATNSGNSATASAASATAAEGSAGALAFKYTFDSSTSMADPGTNGEFRWNNSTVGSASQLSIRAATADTGNPDISPYIITWDDSTSTVNGHVLFRKSGTPATFAIFQIGSITDNGAWLQIGLTHVASNGTWSNADAGYIAFIGRNGDKGDTGSQGVQGVQGATGSTGPVAEAFKTIAISGQSSVVADAAEDTLTLVNGTGITMTTNAGSDQITITATAADPVAMAIALG